MRRFYRNVNDIKFDDELVAYINSFDRLILGGGTYFDVMYAESHTGTTLDMSEKFVDKIKIPVLVNAMGIVVYYRNQCAIDKFRHFFANICARGNWQISLRNDGSKKCLSKLLGNDEDFVNVKIVPDNGYVFNFRNYERQHGLVGLSITDDLFTDEFNDGL